MTAAKTFKSRYTSLKWCNACIVGLTLGPNGQSTTTDSGSHYDYGVWLDAMAV